MHPTRVVVGLPLVMLLAGAAWAQPPIEPDVAYELMAEPGRWAEVDGKLQKDGTFLAKEVEIFSVRDSSNMEDVQIYGAVKKLDRRRSSMKVLGYRIFWDGETTIKDQNKRRILSSKLKNDIGVKVQGYMRANGTFKATKIKLKEGKVKDGKVKAKEKLVGPVEVLDARDGWLRILNTDIKVRPDAVFTEVPVEVAEDEG
ncbi:MAG: DUF5666 domain-containing protein [Candidatus Krumholzibacteriia bacterium]